MSQPRTPSDQRTTEDWQHAHRQALYQKVVCAITQCSVDLLAFDEVRRRLNLNRRVERGLEKIPLDRIRGSVGRYDDFTSTFLPRKSHLRDRWKRVDKAFQEGKTPPIDVYQVDTAYFVLDGNHRVSVARELGIETIEAYVTEFSTPFGNAPEEDLDTHLLQIEHAVFQEKLGGAGEEAAGELKFTCPGCYRLLAGQIENYQEGQEKKQGQPVSIEQAYTGWFAEVYTPAIQAIHAHNLLGLFPDRTEADLFIWAWENGQALKELVMIGE